MTRMRIPMTFDETVHVLVACVLTSLVLASCSTGLESVDSGGSLKLHKGKADSLLTDAHLSLVHFGVQLGGGIAVYLGTVTGDQCQ